MVRYCRFSCPSVLLLLLPLVTPLPSPLLLRLDPLVRGSTGRCCCCYCCPSLQLLQLLLPPLFLLLLGTAAQVMLLQRHNLAHQVLGYSHALKVHPPAGHLGQADERRGGTGGKGGRRGEGCHVWCVGREERSCASCRGTVWYSSLVCGMAWCVRYDIGVVW